MATKIQKLWENKFKWEEPVIDTKRYKISKDKRPI